MNPTYLLNDSRLEFGIVFGIFRGFKTAMKTEMCVLI